MTGIDADDIDSVDRAAQAIRVRIRSHHLPAAVEQAIRAAYAAMGADMPVAVRSSATAEDLPDASFAGQQDTYLWVRGADDVIEALGPVAESAPAQAEMPLAVPQPAIPAPPPEKRTLRETAQLHQQILDRLGPSPLAEDQLIRDLSAPAHAVAPVLLDLELDGRIARQAGGLLSLASGAK